MHTRRTNYKKMEKSFNELCHYTEEKFNDMNDKYDELKATLSNDIVEKLKETLNKEISKIIEKLEVQIHQFCQNKSFLQEQIRELKKKQNRIKPLQLLMKK